MGFTGFMFWYAGTLLEVSVIVIAIRRGSVRRFWDVCLYLGLDCAASISRYLILQHYGLASSQYTYFYYYGDALLTVAMVLVLVRLSGHVFGIKTRHGIPLRIAVPCFAGVTLFSYGAVSQSARLMTHLVVQLSQNLYFVSLLLVLILWAGTIAKNMSATAEVKFVWIFAIYFALLAAIYFTENLRLDNRPLPQLAQLLAGVWVPAAMALVIWSENSHSDIERY